ncbi:hypothetical protein NQ318_022204, partial [Aromia moschata]
NEGNNNVHCKFCSEDIATKKFLRHLIRKHKNEDENILEFPKNSKKRRQALSLLRNDTNFNLFIQGIVRPKEQRFKNFVKDDEFMIHSMRIFFGCQRNSNQRKINHVSRSHTLTACVTDPTNVIFQLNVKRTEIQ